MHPREEQLNDYVDAALDAADHESVARHLDQCAECALFVAQLQQIVLDVRSLPLNEPPGEVWQRINSELAGARLAGLRERAESKEQGAESEARAAKSGARRLWAGKPAWALAMTAAIVMAFLAGRVIEQREQREQQLQRSQGAVAIADRANGANGATKVAPHNSNGDNANVRERVLLVAVGDHLERSQMVLVELANAQTKGELDISTERQYADELLASNRLYRQTAVQLGQTNVAGVLDDLERVLVEVARGPSQVSVQQLAEIQQRIEAQGILFKVKIIGSEVRERGNSSTPGKKAPVS